MLSAVQQIQPAFYPEAVINVKNPKKKREKRRSFFDLLSLCNHMFFPLSGQILIVSPFAVVSVPVNKAWGPNTPQTLQKIRAKAQEQAENKRSSV